MTGVIERSHGNSKRLGPLDHVADLSADVIISGKTANLPNFQAALFTCLDRHEHLKCRFITVFQTLEDCTAGWHEACQLSVFCN